MRSSHSGTTCGEKVVVIVVVIIIIAIITVVIVVVDDDDDRWEIGSVLEAMEVLREEVLLLL